jgi:hypothetical protein
MLFDVQAALAEILNDAAPLANPANLAKPQPPNSGISGISSHDPAEIAPTTALSFAPKPTALGARDPLWHGRSITGSLKTWTGRIVSLDEWLRLSDWERHGSKGKLWNGLSRRWEDRGQA